MANNVAFFAIHCDEVERARRFYGFVFDWRFEAWGPPGFYLVHTGTDDDPGILGAIQERHEPLEGTRGDSEATGGERTAEPTGNHVMRGFECTVSVQDLPEIRRRVVEAGGELLYDEVEIETVGTLIQFLDTEGNVCNAMKYLDQPH
jgi:predicted enzyme related to lactoylglutathione lyase